MQIADALQATIVASQQTLQHGRNIDQQFCIVSA
jgi:hypothetical protein